MVRSKGNQIIPNSNKMEEGQYIQPKTKKVSKFWRVLTVVIIVAASLLIIWTYFTGKSPTQDNSSLQANSLTPAVSEGSTKSDPNADPDKDNLTNKQEQQYGTNPSEADTDKDGFTDGEEVKNGYNPNGPGRLEVDASTTQDSSDSNKQSNEAQAEFAGVPLDTVFNGSGQGYACSITGGTSELNTVKLSVKGKKVRQETPLNGSTLIMIINDQTFYMSGFEDGKYLRLTYDRDTGVASGEGAQVKNGIFTSKDFVLATPIKKVECQEKVIADSTFEVSDNLLVNP